MINKEIETIPQEDDAITIIASGPLTSEVLAKSIGELTGQDYFYFYDAAAPLISKESIDMSKAYRASRYGKGTADYINCPMDKEEYEKFWQELTTAELATKSRNLKKLSFLKVVCLLKKWLVVV